MMHEMVEPIQICSKDMEILVVPHTHFVVHSSCYTDDVLVSPDDQQDNLITSSSIGIISDSHQHGCDSLIASSFMRFIDDELMMVFDLLPVMSSSEPLRPASRKDAKYLRHGATAPKGRRNSFDKCKRIKEL